MGRKDAITGRLRRTHRILHIIGGNDSGGAMTHLIPLFKILPEFGIDLELLCLGPGEFADRAIGAGIPTEILRMSGATDLRVLQGLRETLTSGTWDVIHTHGARANLPVRLLKPTLPPSMRLFMTVHSDLVLDYQTLGRGMVTYAWDRATVKAVDRIVCVSESLQALLAARGYPAAKLSVIRPSLCIDEADLPMHSSENQIPGPMRAMESTGCVWIGTLARLVRVKDIDLMLDATAELIALQPQTRVAIVGDGPERQRLEAKARKLGLRRRVAFTGWLRPVWPILSRLSVFWLSSKSEGIPLSALEAMAGGLPVVATNVGGLSEVVDHGETGLLVPRTEDRARTARDLANAAASLIRNKTWRRAMGAAGAKRVSADFEPKKAAKLYADLYAQAG